MRNLKKQERIAIEAVARRFSATWEKAGVMIPPTPLSWSLGNGLRCSRRNPQTARHGPRQGRQAAFAVR